MQPGPEEENILGGRHGSVALTGSMAASRCAFYLYLSHTVLFDKVLQLRYLFFRQIAKLDAPWPLTRRTKGAWLANVSIRNGLKGDLAYIETIVLQTHI